MVETLHLYCRYIGVSVRGQMQYRASFVLMSIGQLFATGMEFLGIWALFYRFGSLVGWSLPEIALFYGMIHCAFAFADGFGRGFDVFPSMVKSGDFDRLLVRPRSTVFQVAARDLQLMRVGRLAQGLLVLLWAVGALGITWTVPLVGLLLAAIAGAACFFVGLFVLQATLSFWTIETLEICNTLTYGGVETAEFPLSIYRTWFRWFFTLVVPLACANYYPGLAILGRPDPCGAPAFISWLAPLCGPLFLGASMLVWRAGVRHYTSTGS